MKYFFIATVAVCVLIFGWKYFSILQVADTTLESLNTNQFCSISSDCEHTGGNGEICGTGGVATICLEDSELKIKLEKRQCSCLKNVCKWAKPIILF